jgi:hypothetical protein
MKSLCNSLLVAMVFVVSGAASAAELPLRFYGYAYDLTTNQYLYTEVHDQKTDGDRWLSGTIAYYDTDGKKIGNKTLDFTNDPYVPVYRMELTAPVYMEGITDNHDVVEMVRRAVGSKTEEIEHVRKKKAMAADSGFHMLIRAHFDQLLRGEVVPFMLAVAGNLDSFKFRIKRVNDTRFEDAPAIRLRVEPDSLLSLLVDPLELTYTPQTGKLLEYRGVSNILDPASGKPYNTRISYYSKPPADGPRLLPPLPR